MPKKQRDDQSKKFTKEQLRIAIEVVDQEEAIAAERERRSRQLLLSGTSSRRGAPGPNLNSNLELRASVKDVLNRSRRNQTTDPKGWRKKQAIRIAAFGLLAMWLFNGIFRLYAFSEVGSLYRQVLIWAIPLAWIVIVVAWYLRIFKMPEAPRLSPSEEAWWKAFDDYNHGRTDTPPPGMNKKGEWSSRSQRVKRVGRSDWFTIDDSNLDDGYK